ncbi:MAG: hypothetical protein L0G49_01950 [Luteococcus sp.]|nr:hypothetical protein [Luteococcus sp.]
MPWVMAVQLLTWILTRADASLPANGVAEAGGATGVGGGVGVGLVEAVEDLCADGLALACAEPSVVACSVSPPPLHPATASAHASVMIPVPREVMPSPCHASTMNFHARDGARPPGERAPHRTHQVSPA